MNLYNTAMKVILLTGATDGIGREAAKLLATQGHSLLLHGRSLSKLEDLSGSLRGEAKNDQFIEHYVADLSDFAQIQAMAEKSKSKHAHVDVLINNAGVFKVDNSCAANGLDVRFAVNTIAPYLLTKKLLPIIPKHGRVVNLSSAAQSTVDIQALLPHSAKRLSDNGAYAQSKLAITMWSYHLSLLEEDHVIVSVNPASFLGTKMVKAAYGVPGKDIQIGADIIAKAATSKSFENSSGKYFDNDSGSFQPPHPDGTNKLKCAELVSAMDSILAGMGL